MSDGVCLSCRRTRPVSPCEVCFEEVCSNCEHFLGASTFSFLKEVPSELSHSHYCQGCYDSKVEPALESYRETMKRAEKVYVFFTSQRKSLPVLRRSKEKISVEKCEDRDETILRLAFFAAQQDYNAILETDVASVKVRDAGYEHKVWRGSALPVQVDAEKVERFTRQGRI